MNSIKKIVPILFVISILFSCLCVTASAAEKTEDLFTLDQSKNMGISVTYDVTAPTVKFIAPNGEEYGQTAISQGKIEFHDTGDALFYRIPNAMAGTWKIVYDKKTNTECEVSYSPYVEAFTIDSFNYNMVNNESMDVSFLVSHSDNIYFIYNIYATVKSEDYTGNGKLIASGSGTANKGVTTSVDLYKLSSYNGYSLLLEIIADTDGFCIADTMYADKPFSYTNPDSSEAPDGFYTELNITAESLYIDWSETNARGNKTLVALYFDKATEPSYYTTFEDEYTSTEVTIDSTVSEIRVDVAYYDYYGVLSVISSRTIDMSVAKAVQFNCGDVTAAAQGEFTYDFSSVGNGKYNATLTVNENTQDIVLSGKNSIAVALDEFSNNVYLKWYYNEYTAFVVGGEVYSDRIAPNLNILDITDTVKTDKATFVLSGIVDTNCTLKINGVETPYDASGVFTVTLDLVAGENVFEVVAIGPNGNTTKQTIVAIRVEPGVITGSGVLGTILSLLPLIITLIVSLVICLFVIISRKSYKKRFDELGSAVARYTLLRNIFILLSIFAGILLVVAVVMLILTIRKLNSMLFIETALTSILNAYDMIAERNKYIIMLVVCALLLALFIFLSVLFTKFSKNPPKKKVKEKKEKVKKEKTEKKSIIEGLPTGNKPAEASVAPAEVKRFCPSCGTENAPGTVFCKNCGTNISPNKQ